MESPVLHVGLFLIPRSTFEGAAGKVYLGFEEGPADPSHQEGGFGARTFAGGFHYHGGRADLLGLPLRVPRRLVGAPAPQVRTSILDLCLKRPARCVQ